MPKASSYIRVRGQSGKQLLAVSSSQFDFQADIPQTRIILAKGFRPGVAKAESHCGAPVISVTDGKASLVYQHAQ